MTRIEKNKQAHRDIFDKKLNRHLGVVQGPRFVTEDYVTSEKPIEYFAAQVVKGYEKWMEISETVQDDGVPFPVLMTATHIYALCFGAEPHFYEDSNPYVKTFVRSAAEADKIPEPKLASSRPLMRVFELAAAVQKALGKDVTLGCPDMQTGFDTACILWDKTDLMYAMVDNPAAVKRLAEKCERLLFDFVETYRKEFPLSTFGHCPSTWTPPERGPWVSNDECGIMSQEMFEDFCLPEMIRMSQKFGSFGMHCCANAQHQFELFKKIPNFYAFDRGPTGVGWEGDNALAVLGGPQGPTFVTGWDSALVSKFAPEGTRFIFNLNAGEDLDAIRRKLDEARNIPLVV